MASTKLLRPCTHCSSRPPSSDMTCQTNRDTEPVSSLKVDTVVPDDVPPLPSLLCDQPCTVAAPPPPPPPPPLPPTHLALPPPPPLTRDFLLGSLLLLLYRAAQPWHRPHLPANEAFRTKAENEASSPSPDDLSLDELLLRGDVYDKVDNVFSVKAPAALTGKSMDSGASRAQSTQALKILDDREYQQLAIVLRKLRGVPEHVIVNGFVTLHKDVLEAPFVSFIAAKLLNGTYDVVINNAKKFPDFREYEKVVYKIVSVPHIRERLQIWTAMNPLSDDLSKLAQNGRTLATALESVVASESLATVFKVRSTRGNPRYTQRWNNTEPFDVVLKALPLVGNHMNGGNAKATAVGLELSSIVAVSQDTKSGDGKTTLLDFVAGVLEHHVPSATVEIFAELESVSAAAAISLDELTKSLSDTEKLIRSSQQLLDSAMSKPSGEEDTFFSHAKGVFQSANARCRGIKELLKRTSDALKGTQERRAKEKEADRMRNASPRKLKSAANAADGQRRMRPHPPTASIPSAMDGSRCLPTPPSGFELAVGSSWSLYLLSGGREGEEVGRVLGKSSLNDSTLTVAANDILCVDGSA
ncbi:Protein diaphanous 1 [Gonapodya sp. JEL0774]|nr:Protein diaphanous 1 [Gonapodya sp. JEL0774]